jgi:hypothetical protein
MLAYSYLNLPGDGGYLPAREGVGRGSANAENRKAVLAHTDSPRRQQHNPPPPRHLRCLILGSRIS